MSKIVYRYDDAEYDPGETVRARGDSLETLTENQKIVEAAIRSTEKDSNNIRGTSLYTWENEALARRLWKYSKKKYLYELEVDDGNIRHRGDLNWYSAAVDAVAMGDSPNEGVTKYWSGESAGEPFTEPRIEVLVSGARVIRKLGKKP